MESKDLIELMQCKNCKHFKNNKCLQRPTGAREIDKDGKVLEHTRYEDTELNDTCSFWEQVDKTEDLKEIYLDLKSILKEFVDTKEENYDILAIWIMGTWIHSSFETYPYLFINAMKGSGKTRLLKLIKELSWEGDMLASLSEAVLFRTTGTLCIDEFEYLGGKDKNSLRELLNTAYKKGGKVKRMKKQKSLQGEEQVVESFETFRPITMANIWGMEEVLGDRCISIILEKSNNSSITRKIENFSTNPKIVKVKQKLLKNNIWCSLCSVVTQKNIYNDWNNYIDNTTLYTLTTLTTQNNTNNTTKEEKHFFEKIYETNINGRNLELTFPLLILSEDIGVLDIMLEVLKKTIEEKKTEDIMESRDVMLFSFVAKQMPGDWHKIKDLTHNFKMSVDYDSNEEHWCNPKWMGKALKRLGLRKEDRRIGSGNEVVLNIDKAKEKMEMFK